MQIRATSLKKKVQRGNLHEPDMERKKSLRRKNQHLQVLGRGKEKGGGVFLKEIY